MAKAKDNLVSKLDELDTRHHAVMELMNDSAVASNREKIVALAKEMSYLGRIVEPYRIYKSLLSQVEEAQSIIDDSDSDDEFRALASDEIGQLTVDAQKAMAHVKGLLVMGDDAQIDSVVLEIRAGTGGAEAGLFCGDLLGMYRHYCDNHGWKIEIISAHAGEMGGFREVIMSVRGSNVWSKLGYEGGGHRVQRVPKTESQGRIHTSAATVAVLAEPENVEVDIDWDKDVLEHVSRAGGPGGQSVNKIESAIKLEHLETGITVSMRDEKSQHKNRAKARRIMAARVFEFHRSKQLAEEAATRKEMIGSGDRSQRIRTYNYPQNRCTDHRLKGEGAEGANFNLDRIIAGDMDNLVNALVARDKARRLAQLGSSS